MEGALDITWVKVIDQTRCIGCHACTTACKSENEVPLGVTRTYVKNVDIGVFPSTRRAFQVTRCNQCDDPPCVEACPTSAMFRRPDGIVDFDKSICIGCKACMAACPYDAIFINPEDHSAEKCNFCAHRLEVGLEPACVIVCPVEAILVGDLHDPASRVARYVNQDAVQVRRPEKGTRPKLYYKGAHAATLDPIAARQPPGGLFMWSQQPAGKNQLTSGHPSAGSSSAAALLSYDIGHHLPWDWRVGLYTWTKGIAAGTYLTGIALALLGLLPWEGSLLRVGVPLVSGLFLVLTGLALIWDLEHPERFFYVLIRPQWRSWLARGAAVISLYGAVLAGHFLLGLGGHGRAAAWLAAAGVPLAVLTAVYTAYLFAQARGRDLWQSPLLPPHMAVQALALGAAALAPLTAWLEPRALPPILILLAVACAVHLLLVAAEATLAHPTAHAQLAAHNLFWGRLAPWLWGGAALVLVAVFAPWLGPAAALPALLGLLAHEHGYVQAGQSVPLA